MSNQTYYIGLSMAGTVSAGTYTGGTLVELNRWLSSWSKAKKNGVTLKAEVDTPNYKVGDEIHFAPHEVPQHDVKIKSITGASGGGVSAVLFLAGLTSGKLEEFLYNIWTTIDVEEMLDTSDLTGGKPIYSVLNTLPIDNLMKDLLKRKWDETDYARETDYLDDYIELYMTLASLEGIPYKTTGSAGSSVSYGLHKTHIDYIKFNFLKNGSSDHKNTPYGFDLRYNSNSPFGDDPNWHKLIESAPATAAFPFGFKPRTLKRIRKEYDNKLFYFKYAFSSDPNTDRPFSELSPAWVDGHPDDEFDMEYVDGGTFNRDPHDLARASLLKNLDVGNKLPNNGKDTIASVILIDPFPSNEKKTSKPGEIVDSIPSIFGLTGLMVGALTNQGRFRPDWIERTLSDTYYSRLLISPVRRNTGNSPADCPLAGGLLEAFSGFIDKSYREHDYKLGHFNSFQFFNRYFKVPTNNVVVKYGTKESAIKEKYEAVGWVWKNTDEQELCQVIPRTFNSDDPIANKQPEWPSMTKKRWEVLSDKALERAKQIADSATNFGSLTDSIIDAAAWNLVLKSKVKKGIEQIGEQLKEAGLLEE